MWLLVLSALADPTVRVATYNVWGLPWPVTPRRGARMAAVDGWLASGRYDLVGLQEAWRGARSDLPESLHYPRSDGDSGLALYTPHPMRRLGFVEFVAQRGADRFKSKGVWWVTVELPDREWTVGVVHLQAGTGAVNSEVRAEQLRTVLASMPSGPVILMGDFNFHRGSERDRALHDALVERGLQEAQPVKDRGTSRYGSHRLDRMYVTESASWTVGRAKALRAVPHSDHFPVSVELTEPE